MAQANWGFRASEYRKHPFGVVGGRLSGRGRWAVVWGWIFWAGGSVFGGGDGLVGWAAEAMPSWEAPLLRQWLQSSGMEIHLVRGRLEGTARSMEAGLARRAVAKGRTEHIFMQGAGQSMKVSYESESPRQKYVLQMDSNRSAVIGGIFIGDEGTWEVQCIQEALCPVKVRVLGGSKGRQWQASSLWHLAMEDPEMVRKYLIPLLRPFLPEADLLGQVEEVQRQMLSKARNLLPQADTQRWQALVAQLADPQYTRREAADRALRQAGPAVVPFLRNLDSQRLDAEQRFRIRRILRDLQKNEQTDTISGVADWLLYDPEIWWILLDRPEPQTRRIASEQLSALLGEPVEFDPEASAEVRAAQRQRLESKVRATSPRSKY